MTDGNYRRLETNTTKTNETILNNSKALFRRFINITIMFIALAVLGCFDFLNFKFDFTTLKTWNYWLKVIMRGILLILMFNVGTNLLYDKELAGNVELQKYKKEFEEKNKLRDTNFEYYIERVLNPKIKRQTYIKRIQQKIYKLEKHASSYEKTLFFSTLPERQEEKKNNKYCKKKQALLDLISDEYLDKAIDDIDVKYSYVNPSIFNLDIAEGVVINNFKTKSEEGKARSKKTISSVCTMIFSSMFLSSILLDPKLWELYTDMTYIVNTIVTFIADIGFCIFQVSRGVMYTKKLVNQELVIPYANRCKILDQYLEWNANNPESSVHKVTKFIEQSEETTEVKPNERS